MEIAHNETVFLSGASGAGKTTLLYTLAGLERPESGTVEFEGRDFTAAPPPRRRVFEIEKWVLFSRVTFFCRNLPHWKT